MFLSTSNLKRLYVLIVIFSPYPVRPASAEETNNLIKVRVAPTEESYIIYKKSTQIQGGNDDTKDRNYGGSRQLRGFVNDRLLQEDDEGSRGWEDYYVGNEFINFDNLVETPVEDWSSEEWFEVFTLILIAIAIFCCMCCLCLLPICCCGRGSRTNNYGDTQDRSSRGCFGCIKDIICLWCCFELCCTDDLFGSDAYSSMDY